MNKKLLEVCRVSKEFNHGFENKALHDVSFEVDVGSSIGIIGESGSGKSTLANIIAGFMKPTSGEIRFHGKSIQMIFQDPKTSFSPLMSIGQGIEEGILYQKNFSKKERLCKVEKVLEKVCLNSSYVRRKSKELSGGECQRAAIARAIISEPDLLICDEMTSSLDVLEPV